MNHDIPLKYFDIADEYATDAQSLSQTLNAHRWPTTSSYCSPV